MRYADTEVPNPTLQDQALNQAAMQRRDAGRLTPALEHLTESALDRPSGAGRVARHRSDEAPQSS